MKAILLGASGFWKEITLDDYPPTLNVPWMSGRTRIDPYDGHDNSGYEVIRFDRIAIGYPTGGFAVPGCVVYRQEQPLG